MKRILLALLLALPLAASAQPILRNSITTNTLGTNLVWIPSAGAGALQIEQNAGAFQILSNGIAEVEISPSTGGNVLPALNLKQYLQFGSSSNRLTRSGANLLWDGLALNGSSGTTNYYNYIYATNMTVLNTLTVSNIVVTNVTVQNNLTVSNLFTVNGSHNTLIVTQYVRMPWQTLAMTGTNVAQIDLNAGSMFRVYLSANAFFGAVANHPGTNTSQTIQVALIQDGTGGRAVTMTNSTWFLSGSGATTNAMPTLNSNINAISVLTFVTSPTNAVQLLGVPTTISP